MVPATRESHARHLSIGIMEEMAMDAIIEIFADIADICFDLWINKIIDRFTKKKRANIASDNMG